MQNLTSKWYFWLGLVVLFLIAYGVFTRAKNKKAVAAPKTTPPATTPTPAAVAV